MARAAGTLRYETIKALMQECAHNVEVCWCRDDMTQSGILADYDDDARTLVVTCDGFDFSVDPSEIAVIRVAEYA